MRFQFNSTVLHYSVLSIESCHVASTKGNVIAAFKFTEYCVNKSWSSFEILLQLRHGCLSLATSVNTDHSYRLRRKGTFVELALFRNSTAFNTSKCSLGTKFPCPVSQVQEGDAEEERRKARCHYCAEMSCSHITPPHSSICLYSHESISLEKTSWTTESL